MKPLEYVQQSYTDEMERHQSAMKEIDKELELVRLLPDEIADIDDCNYVDYMSWNNQLQVRFDSPDTARLLKMAGVQGLKTSHYESSYPTKHIEWRWTDGTLTYNSTTFILEVSKAEQPNTCRIEEVTEVLTAPVTRLKVICTQTGEEI